MSPASHTLELPPRFIIEVHRPTERSGTLFSAIPNLLALSPNSLSKAFHLLVNWTHHLAFCQALLLLFSILRFSCQTILRCFRVAFFASLQFWLMKYWGACEAGSTLRSCRRPSTSTQRRHLFSSLKMMKNGAYHVLLYFFVVLAPFCIFPFIDWVCALSWLANNCLYCWLVLSFFRDFQKGITLSMAILMRMPFSFMTNVRFWTFVTLYDLGISGMSLLYSFWAS